MDNNTTVIVGVGNTDNIEISSTSDTLQVRVLSDGGSTTLLFWDRDIAREFASMIEVAADRYDAIGLVGRDGTLVYNQEDEREAVQEGQEEVS